MNIENLAEYLPCA